MDPSGNPPKLRIGGGPNHSWRCPAGETNQDGTKLSESTHGLVLPRPMIRNRRLERGNADTQNFSRHPALYPHGRREFPADERFH